MGEAVHLLVSLYLSFESVGCISQIIPGFINQLVIFGIICHLFDTTGSLREPNGLAEIKMNRP